MMIIFLGSVYCVFDGKEKILLDIFIFMFIILFWIVRMVLKREVGLVISRLIGLLDIY